MSDHEDRHRDEDHPDEDHHADIADAKRELALASGSLRQALRRLHDSEDQAWRDYATDVDDTIERMELDLAVSSARLDAERAKSKHELEDALDQATRAWRQRADEIRVQSHLGEMDARDQGLVAVAEIEAVGHRLAHLVEVVRHDATEWSASLRAEVGEVIGDVRGVVGGLVLVARADDDDPDDASHPG